MMGPSRLKNVGKRQGAAYGPYKLHGLGKQLCMQIDDAALVDRTVQLVDIVGEHSPMVLDDVRRTTHTRCREVAVLGHLISRSGDDKARGGRDVERVLAVASRSHHVDVAVAVEWHEHSGLQDAIAKAKQFIDCNAAHLYAREQCRNLRVGEFAMRDGDEQLLGLFTFQSS
jgi:NAD-specific glutamate dehydrogenase